MVRYLFISFTTGSGAMMLRPRKSNRILLLIGLDDLCQRNVGVAIPCVRIRLLDAYQFDGILRACMCTSHAVDTVGIVIHRSAVLYADASPRADTGTGAAAYTGICDSIQREGIHAAVLFRHLHKPLVESLLLFRRKLDLVFAGVDICFQHSNVLIDFLFRLKQFLLLHVEDDDGIIQHDDRVDIISLFPMLSRNSCARSATPPWCIP